MVTFDNSENIPARALQSPALIRQQDKKSKYPYPEKWEGKVPLKIKMIKTVTSDIPIVMPGSADYIAIARNEYYCWVNSYGAVTALLPDNKELGVKPDEFEVVEFHNVMK